MVGNNENGGWHLDKRFSWGHIATTIGLVVGGLLAFTDLGTRVQVNSTEIDHNAESIDRIESSVNEQYREIIRMLERLDDRVANHMEKGD